MLNPNVLVREMGVMEKCTFCIQRIREFKDEWRDSRDFKQGVASTGDYSRITACASACPSNAISFGNLKDEDSEVSKQFSDRRAFKMLNELNTKPGVAYLTRIVHAEETFMHHGGHGEHGAAHGDGHDSDEGHGAHGSDAGHDDGHDHKEKAH
jgi:molybdopterin-containing oxidoreductase family iron-sulfur binding subunit